MENTKKCTKCSEELPLDQFYKKKYRSGNIGYFSRCKKCIRVVSAKQYEDNKTEAKAVQAEWRNNNREKARERAAKWREDNPGKRREMDARYYQNNKEARRVKNARYRRRRMCTDPDFKLTINIRGAMSVAIRNNTKCGHTIELLGCSIEYLRQHLENQFTKDMSWSNYGRYGWHIDHIIPLSYFDMSDPEQQKRAWHYTNLRPLWADDNLKKSNKIEERQLLLL